MWPDPTSPLALADLDRSLSSIEAVVDPDRKRAEIAASGAAGSQLRICGTTQINAQRVTSRLSVTAEPRSIELLGCAPSWTIIGALVELGQEEEIQPASPRRRKLLRLAADRRSRSLEVRTLLSGEYDEREALVTIRSEAGGVDAADFADMLLRMYLRWAERHRYSTEVYDTSYAEEAGIKSATFQVKAPFAYGTPVGGAGHAPAGAHLAIRQPGTPPDLVRRRGSAAGDRGS